MVTILSFYHPAVTTDNLPSSCNFIQIIVAIHNFQLNCQFLFNKVIGLGWVPRFAKCKYGTGIQSCQNCILSRPRVLPETNPTESTLWMNNDKMLRNHNVKNDDIPSCRVDNTCFTTLITSRELQTHSVPYLKR